MRIYKDCDNCKNAALEDITCDICQKSCKIQISEDMYNFNCATINASFGYGSTEHDGETYESDICEACFFVLRTQHQIKAKTSLSVI